MHALRIEMSFFCRRRFEVRFISSDLWLWLCVLLLVSRVSNGCSTEERTALLEISVSLFGTTDSFAGLPLSWWPESDHDCCSWKGVECSNDTGRVFQLQLSSLGGGQPQNGPCRAGFISTAFSAFPELQFLDFSMNYATFQSWDGLAGLSKLRHLDLSFNCLNANDSESLGKLFSLEVLHLEFNDMVGTLPASVFENLTGLQELDLSSNQLTGNLPASLFTLPRIQHLNVSQNHFEGSIPMSSNLNHSSSFRTVNISMNNLSGNFSFHWLRNMANLEKIDFSRNVHLAVGVNFPGWKPPFQLKELLLSGCDVDKSIFTEPHFLRTQNHLETLDLSNSSLPGSFPSWLFAQQPALLYLNLGNNWLSGSLDQIIHTQTSLLAISLSLNRISGRLPANISSIFPNATLLDFSGNTISGEIPPDLCNISNMEYLDLSNNSLQGELPSCLFADHPILKTLKVSNNKLGGPILGGKSHLSIGWEIYLDGNNFEGELPRYLTGNFVDTGTIDFHGNKLSGKLDVLLWSLPKLSTLNLGSNNLTGEIDQNICGLTSIVLLDISNNNISGSLPNCSKPLSLLFLNMSANLLSGDIAPYSFFNNTIVTALDLSYNQFTGSIDWVQTLDEVRYLSLGTNKFEGQIPQTICQLQYVRVIDLSHNRLSGSLPACIGDLPFEGKSSGLLYWNLICERGFQYPGFRYTSCYEQRGFRFGTKRNRYTYRRNFMDFFSGFDFSENMLSGEIPPELGHLSHLKALNLSHNSLDGLIPAALGNMSDVESLDLSHNQLSGAIPSQLSRLSSLAVFSVAYNYLSGCVPDGGQLGSFDATSYVGNRDLEEASRGSSECAAGSEPPDASLPPSQHSGDEAAGAVLYAVSAASFVLSFWVTVGFMFCHPYGRHVILKL